MVCVVSIQLFYCIMKVTIDNTQINGPDCSSNITLFTKEEADSIIGHHLLPLHLILNFLRVRNML